MLIQHDMKSSSKKTEMLKFSFSVNICFKINYGRSIFQIIKVEIAKIKIKTVRLTSFVWKSGTVKILIYHLFWKTWKQRVQDMGRWNKNGLLDDTENNKKILNLPKCIYYKLYQIIIYIVLLENFKSPNLDEISTLNSSV